MKRIPIEKLWGLVSRIDTIEKVSIAEKFICECDLSNEEFDDLMDAISSQCRFIYEIEADKRLKPQYQRYTH